MSALGQRTFRNKAQGRHATAQVQRYSLYADRDLRQQAVDARLLLGRRPNPQEPRYYGKDRATALWSYRQNRSRRVPNKDMAKATEKVLAACQDRVIQEYPPAMQPAVREIVHRKDVVQNLKMSIVRYLSDLLSKMTLASFDADAAGEWVSIEAAFLAWIGLDEERGGAQTKNLYGPSKFDVERVQRIYSILKAASSVEPQDIQMGVVLNESDALQAYELLKKYRRQLPEAGIFFDKIIPPLSREESEALSSELEGEKSEVRELMEIAQGKQLKQPIRSEQKDIYGLSQRIAKKSEKTQLIEIFHQVLYEKGLTLAKTYASRAESSIHRQKEAKQKKEAIDQIAVVPVSFGILSSSVVNPTAQNAIYYLGNRHLFSIAEDIHSKEEAAKKGYIGANRIDLDSFLTWEDKSIKYGKKGYTPRHIQGFFPINWYDLQAGEIAEADVDAKIREHIPSFKASGAQFFMKNNPANREVVVSTYAEILRHIAPFTMPQVASSNAYPTAYEESQPLRLAAQISEALQANGKPPFYFEDYTLDKTEARNLAENITRNAFEINMLAKDGDLFLIETTEGSEITGLDLLIVEQGLTDPLHLKTLYKSAFLSVLSGLDDLNEPLPRELLDANGNIKASLLLDPKTPHQDRYALLHRLYQVRGYMKEYLEKLGLYTFAVSNDFEYTLKSWIRGEQPILDIPPPVRSIIPSLPESINYGTFGDPSWSSDPILGRVSPYSYKFPIYSGLGVKSIFRWNIAYTHSYRGRIGYQAKQKTLDNNFYLDAEDQRILQTHPALSSTVSMRRLGPDNLSKMPNNYAMLHLFLRLHKLGLPIESSHSKKAKKKIKEISAETAKDKLLE